MGVGRHRHQRTIFGALKEADVSVRRRAADLLFAMATADNAVAIVDELLTYLTIADASMRADMVLKTAVLAEKCDLLSSCSYAHLLHALAVNMLLPFYLHRFHKRMSIRHKQFPLLKSMFSVCLAACVECRICIPRISIALSPLMIHCCSCCGCARVC